MKTLKYCTYDYLFNEYKMNNKFEICEQLNKQSKFEKAKFEATIHICKQAILLWTYLDIWRTLSIRLKTISKKPRF